jgi:hypothetical protein
MEASSARVLRFGSGPSFSLENLFQQLADSEVTFFAIRQVRSCSFNGESIILCGLCDMRCFPIPYELIDRLSKRY